VLALGLYVWLHAMILTFEMFIIHVVLTIQTDSWFTYVFLNCLGELKISVFKKVDSASTFQFLCDDSVDRLNLTLFILAAVIQTSQDLETVLWQGFMLFMAKILVDYTKHFFLTRFNKINI
jgi:hypothetical protein